MTHGEPNTSGNAGRPEEAHSKGTPRKEERQLQQILDGLFAFVGLLSPEGVLLEVNRAPLEATGLKREDVIGKSFVESRWFSFSRELQRQVQSAISRAAQGESVRFDTITRIADGKRIDIDFSVRPLFDDRGRVTELVACAVDITERKRAETARKRMEERYHQAIAGAGAVPYESDFKTHSYVFMGEGIEQLIGYAPHELNGELWQKTIQEAVMLGEAAGLTKEEATRRIISGEMRSWRCDMRVVTRSGESRWISDASVRNVDEAGQFIGCIGILQDITERKRSEESLILSQSMLRIAGRVARLGGWMIQLPERKLIWSDETCLIHDQPPGYQPTFEEGLSLFPPEYRAEVARVVEECVREGKPYEFIAPKITAKGRRIWVRSLGEAVRDGDGKIIRLQGAFQDITEQKLAEMELSKLNRALRMLTACRDALTQASDERQLLTEVCQLAVETGGYRMAWVGYAQDDATRSVTPVVYAGEELGYLSKIKLSWSVDEDGGRGPVGQTIRSGRATVFDDITELAAGFFWLADAQSRGYRGVISLPLRDEKRTFGVLTLYSGEINNPGADELELLQKMAEDLSFGINNLRTRAGHRKAQQEVAQQAALLDKARDAIIVCDLDHRIRFWNKGAEQVYGWKAEEAIGRSASDILFPHLSAFWPAIQGLFQNGEWSGELQKRTKHGQSITVDCSWTLVRNEHPEPDSILCIETDITEKKKLESQFLRAQRMESIGTLAGGIAHDLNNVLSPILMSVALLKLKMPDKETEDILLSLQNSAQRGADLVKQVLSFARGVEGQRVEVNLLHLLREIQNVVRDTFPKSIVFELATCRELWSVVGDPTQLHQVMINLCVNARDAMPAGGNLTISVENALLDETFAAMNPGSRPGSYVLVKVVDTGTGIAPEIQERIFEPFFTTKPVGQGTGLGLSTTMSIVKSHGGFIQVQSEPGKGTTFKVYLAANVNQAASKKVENEQTRPLQGHGELVLLVDDEKAVRKITQNILERFGYRTLEATNGAEAIAIYAQHQADIALVLTDMAMPVMDGFALITSIRTMNPNATFVGCSGFTSPESMAKLKAAGVRHFMSKPYSAETLLKTLHEALNNR